MLRVAGDHFKFQPEKPINGAVVFMISASICRQIPLQYIKLEHGASFQILSNSFSPYDIAIRPY
jgi:hypothetical protein